MKALLLSKFSRIFYTSRPTALNNSLKDRYKNSSTNQQNCSVSLSSCSYLHSAPSEQPTLLTRPVNCHTPHTHSGPHERACTSIPQHCATTGTCVSCATSLPPHCTASACRFSHQPRSLTLGGPSNKTPADGQSAAPPVTQSDSLTTTQHCLQAQRFMSQAVSIFQPYTTTTSSTSIFQPLTTSASSSLVSVTANPSRNHHFSAELNQTLDLSQSYAVFESNKYMDHYHTEPYNYSLNEMNGSGNRCVTRHYHTEPYNYSLNEMAAVADRNVAVENQTSNTIRSRNDVAHNSVSANFGAQMLSKPNSQMLACANSYNHSHLADHHNSGMSQHSNNHLNYHGNNLNQHILNHHGNILNTHHGLNQAASDLNQHDNNRLNQHTNINLSPNNNLTHDTNCLNNHHDNNHSLNPAQMPDAICLRSYNFVQDFSRTNPCQVYDYSFYTEEHDTRHDADTSAHADTMSNPHSSDSHHFVVNNTAMASCASHAHHMYANYSDSSASCYLAAQQLQQPQPPTAAIVGLDACSQQQAPADAVFTSSRPSKNRTIAHGHHSTPSKRVACDDQRMDHQTNMLNVCHMFACPSDPMPSSSSDKSSNEFLFDLSRPDEPSEIVEDAQLLELGPENDLHVQNLYHSLTAPPPPAVTQAAISSTGDGLKCGAMLTHIAERVKSAPSERVTDPDNSVCRVQPSIYSETVPVSGKCVDGIHLNDPSTLSSSSSSLVSHHPVISAEAAQFVMPLSASSSTALVKATASTNCAIYAHMPACTYKDSNKVTGECQSGCGRNTEVRTRSCSPPLATFSNAPTNNVIACAANVLETEPIMPGSGVLTQQYVDAAIAAPQTVGSCCVRTDLMRSASSNYGEIGNTDSVAIKCSQTLQDPRSNPIFLQCLEMTGMTATQNRQKTHTSDKPVISKKASTASSTSMTVDDVFCLNYSISPSGPINLTSEILAAASLSDEVACDGVEASSVIRLEAGLDSSMETEQQPADTPGTAKHSVASSCETGRAHEAVFWCDRGDTCPHQCVLAVDWPHLYDDDTSDDGVTKCEADDDVCNNSRNMAPISESDSSRLRRAGDVCEHTTNKDVTIDSPIGGDSNGSQESDGYRKVEKSRDSDGIIQSRRLRLGVYGSGCKSDDLGERVVICFYCRLHCKNSVELRTHIEAHHSPRLLYDTPLVNQARRRLVIGARVHSVLGASLCLGKPYVCVHCDNVYGSEKALRTHYRDTHTPVLAHVCCECGAGFRRRMQLIRHVTFRCSRRLQSCHSPSGGAGTPDNRTKRPDHGMVAYNASHSAGPRSDCQALSRDQLWPIDLANGATDCSGGPQTGALCAEAAGDTVCVIKHIDDTLAGDDTTMIRMLHEHGRDNSSSDTVMEECVVPSSEHQPYPAAYDFDMAVL